jgi:homoserine O-succinyltransferase
MAIGKYLGVDKIIFAEKICGVYHTNNLETNHPISGALGDFFDCPQSRYASFDENSLKNNSQITPLVFAEGAGHYIIESKDRRFMAHNGHPEYDVERILFEHRRDKLAGLSHIPINFDLENPIDTWTQKGIMFFNAWINFIAEKNNSE